MKASLILALSLILPLSGLHGQTLEWGSDTFSKIVDSKGATLDNTYVFEVGVFASPFTPDETNTASWFANWQAFDRAAYSPTNRYFTSTVQMTDDGKSNSAFLSPTATSFAGLEAYIWVRNSETPSPTTEWFLVKSPSWIFPTATPGCCDNDLPVQWSIADLVPSDTPVWGSQKGVDGKGTFTQDGVYNLQTFTIPEPSAAMMVLLSCTFLLARRKRS